MQDSCKTDDNLQESNKKLCKMFKNHATFLHAIWYVHNSQRNYARFLHNCHARIQQEIMQDVGKNHATLLHAIWYVHKILKEIMQDVQKSCNLLACYLTRTQDSQRNYAICSKIMQPSCMLFDTYTQDSQRNYARCSKIMQPSCMLFDTYTRFSRKVCKKCSKTVQENNVQKPCNILHNFWQELTIHLHTLHTL